MHEIAGTEACSLQWGDGQLPALFRGLALFSIALARSFLPRVPYKWALAADRLDNKYKAKPEKHPSYTQPSDVDSMVQLLQHLPEVVSANSEEQDPSSA